MRIVGSKMYDVCSNCGEIVCLNKRLFGGLHICSTPEEQANHREEIAKRWRQNKYRLDKAVIQSKGGES